MVVGEIIEKATMRHDICDKEMAFPFTLLTIGSRATTVIWGRFGF